MYLIDMLRKLGDRLGIIEFAPASPHRPEPVKVQTRTVTLTELITAIRVTEIRELAGMPAELSVPFEDVFNAAGIKPSAEGWTIDQLEQFLNSEKIRGMNRTEAQHEVLRVLADRGIDSSGIVKDAIARDQALDAFEESITDKRRDWLDVKRRQIRQIEEEISDEEKTWATWRARKRQREKEMARAVAYLIDQPVISIEEE
jgi:hypothetical protein